MDTNWLLKSFFPFFNENQQNLKAIIIISVLVIVVIAIVVPAVILLQNRDQNYNKMRFGDLFNGTFSSRGSGISWSPMGGYTFQQGGVLYKMDTNTNSQTVLLNSSFVSEQLGISYQGFFVSPTEDYILLYNNYTKLWRHSFVADYFLYSVAQRTIQPLSQDKTGFSNALFSPNGRTIAFVYLNNIYLRDIGTGGETVVTTNGSPDNIGGAVKNGVQSWVYEEEIYSGYNAIWFSPDGSKVAFFNSDETNVPTYSFPLYSMPYNTMINIKYPKAGFPNPLVNVGVFDTATNTTSFVNLTAAPSDYLVIAVVWRDTNTLYLRTTDRFQTEEEILLIDTALSTLNPNVIFTRSIENGWLNPSNLQQMTFILNGTLFLDLRRNNDFPQIGLFDSTGGQLVRWLTNSSFPVTAILKIDTANQIVYYQAANTPLERQIFCVNFGGTTQQNVTNPPGSFSASFSADGELYLLNYQGDGSYSVPWSALYSTSNLSLLQMLQDNSALSTAIQTYDLPQKEYFTVTSADGQYQLNGKLIFPPGFSSSKKYPCMLFVYGGPGSQTVRKTYEVGWNEYVASMGIIVASVDGRGTGARSVSFEQSTYLMLGVKETEDQIAAGKYLKSLGYISKVAIYGWSYGGFFHILFLKTTFSDHFFKGYMSSRVITDPNNVFDCAISVAPVTDWTLYDSVYTERFMQSPQTNPAGYNISSNLHQASNLNKPLLLVHGTADDVCYILFFNFYDYYYLYTFK